MENNDAISPEMLQKINDAFGRKIPEIKKTIEAEPRLHLVAKYQLFKKQFNPKTDTIYHPCGANDISPSAAFPESKVIYADLDQQSMEALATKGYNANVVSALEYNPGAVNVLILLNPVIGPEVPSSHVVKDGYVLCNNYHSTATKLHDHNNFKLQGVIVQTNDGPTIDTENLEDCWREVETDTDFRNARTGFVTADFKTAQNIVGLVTGKTENILAEYKKILKKASAEMREEEASAAAEMATTNDNGINVKSLSPDSVDDEVFLNHNGRQYILSAVLPKKKGAVDDIFIFQKK